MARRQLGLALLGSVALLAVVGAVGVASAAGHRSSAKALTFARAFEPVTFDPLKTNGDNGSLWDMVQVYDQLVEYVPGKLDPQPAIAESWTEAKNGLTYTFKLRTMKFSNGTLLTSADVKFSLDRFINPKINPSFAFLAASIKSTSAPDAHTFVLKLKHPDAEIVSALAVPVASIYPKSVFQKVGEAAFGKHPIGSGPFVLKQWVRGKIVDLARNPNYWKPGLPKLDLIHIPYVPDDTTRLLQVQSGQADIAENVPFSQIKTLGSQPNVKVKVEPIEAYDAIWLNHKIAPLANRNVRQALAYALDLNGINRAVYGGVAQIANSTIAKTKYWSASVPYYKYDLNKAKSLLAKTPWAKGFNLSFSVPAGDTVHRAVAIIAKQQWAKLGVNVSITSEDTGALFTDYSKGKFQASIPLPVITSDVLVPDELALAWLQWTPGYEGFFTNYKNAQIGALVNDANKALSDRQRATLWRKIQVQSLTDVPWIPLFFVPARTAVRTNVVGFKTLESGWWDLAHTSLQ